VLVAAGFFGYMLALLQRRVQILFSSTRRVPQVYSHLSSFIVWPSVHWKGTSIDRITPAIYFQMFKFHANILKNALVFILNQQLFNLKLL
jgi:hypothetical protein